jgi:hypothetical protein
MEELENNNFRELEKKIWYHNISNWLIVIVRKTQEERIVLQCCEI